MKPLVLIADNDRAVSSLLVEVLTREGLGVVTAFDGEAAVRVLEEAPVDVLVCDLDMPKKSGLEVLAWLGTHAARPATIVISGYLDVAIERQLDELPFVEVVLRKPFDLFGFRDLVAGLAARAPRSFADSDAAGLDG